MIIQDASYRGWPTGWPLFCALFLFLCALFRRSAPHTHHPIACFTTVSSLHVLDSPHTRHALHALQPFHAYNRFNRCVLTTVSTIPPLQPFRFLHATTVSPPHTYNRFNRFTVSVCVLVLILISFSSMFSMLSVLSKRLNFGTVFFDSCML